MEVSRRAFGLEEANDDVIGLARVMAVLTPLISLTLMVSSTFYMIFVAEAVGFGNYIEGLAVVGSLVVVQMAVQTILDYPTGALGDLVGQRFILASAFMTYAVAYYLVSFVTSITPILFLVLIYGLMGFANSQQSGALATWFDNNYRVAVPEDADRKQYGVFQARMGMIFQLVAMLALVPGGILATVLGRTWVFQLQAVLCLLISATVLRVVKNLPEVDEAARSKTSPTPSEYVDILKSGVSYLFKEPWVKYVVIGSMLAVSTVMVWGNLILFPMYYGYLLTDIAVSAYRTGLFVPGVVSRERSGTWSKRFNPEKWIPRFRLVQAGGFVFYLIFAAILLVFPTPEGGPFIDLVLPFTTIVLLSVPSVSVVPIVLVAITFTFTMISSAMADILTQREMLDAIPNEIRNSMYSLQPTIATLFALPQIALFGWMIPNLGFPLTLVCVGCINFVAVLIIKKGLKETKPGAKEEVFEETILH